MDAAGEHGSESRRSGHYPGSSKDPPRSPAHTYESQRASATENPTTVEKDFASAAKARKQENRTSACQRKRKTANRAAASTTASNTPSFRQPTSSPNSTCPRAGWHISKTRRSSSPRISGYSWGACPHNPISLRAICRHGIAEFKIIYLFAFKGKKRASGNWCACA